MIQNQVLVFRPDRNGKLTLIDSSADETTKAIASKLGIFRLPPGKGISPDLANQRVQAEATWNDGEPPTPNWENLNKNEDNYIMLDDLPDNPSEDEFQLDFETKDLQLTEHQKAMLLPPDKRIKNLQMPSSIKARVKSKKVEKRRSRWAEKYTGVFAGKLAKKWNRAVKRWGYALGFKDLENKAGPTTNLKPTLFPATKRRPKAKGKAQPFLMHESEVQNSPWLQKMVRVVGNEAGQDMVGRVGLVHRVYTRGGEEWARVTEVTLDGGTNQFDVPTKSLVDAEYDSKVHPIPVTLNWNKLKGAKRADVISKLQADKHPDNLEAVLPGKPIEHMTIKAALYELEYRFQDANVVMVHPDVTASLGQSGPLPEDAGGEMAAFIRSIKTAACTYFTIWAENHYTYLKVERSEIPGSPAHGYQFTYMDSNHPTIVPTQEAASNVLRNLGFLAVDAVAPKPSNCTFQSDGWSCGLHVIKWIEIDLRSRRGEPRLPDPSIEDLKKRTNYFIAKIKGYVQQGMRPHTAPTGKGDAAAASSRDVIEPKFDKFEDALDAAQSCQRCIATSYGTKGCRLCMGDFFECIRMKASGLNGAPGRKRPLGGKRGP